jgi:hypothetical protein
MTKPTTISKSGIIFFPLNYRLPNWTVQITRDDATVDTVTSSLINADVTLSATDEGGSCSFTLSNKTGQFTRLWNGGEKVEIWADFAAATTKIFRGIIEKPWYSFGADGHKMIISGRDGSYLLQNVYINENYTDKDVAEIVSSIIAKYATGITYSQSLTNTLIPFISFRDKTAWDAISEALKAAGHDFYIDTNFALQHFLKNSMTCATENLVHGMNMLNCSIGTDLREISNRVKVVGSNVDGSSGCLLLRMKEDTASQATYYLKERVESRTDIEDNSQIETAAEQLLDEYKVPVQNGTASGMGMPTLLPGYKLRMSSPYEDVNGYFRIAQLTHSFSKSNGFTTSVNAGKIKTKISSYLSDMYKKQEEGVDYSNRNNLNHSYVIKFNENPALCTFTDCEQLDGELVLISGKTTATAISSIHTSDIDITKAELRVEGQDLGVSAFYVSNDGGSNYTTVSLDALYNLATTGKNLVIKVVLNSDATNVAPKIKALSCLYT